MSQIERFNMKENLGCSMVRKRPLEEQLILTGHWFTELWRFNKSGSKKVKISEHEAFNDITVAGKNALFDTMFNALTQSSSGSWCAGLVDSVGFTGYNVSTDTMSSHSGWAELTGYSQTTRVAWGQGSSSSGGISNASPIIFDITVTDTVQGLFITNVNTKGATSGLLWSAASYTSPPSCVPGDEIRSTYGLSA